MARRGKPALWVGAVLLAVVIAWAWRHHDLGALLTLDNLKASRDALQARVQARPLGTAALYFGVYVAAAALSIPGALILTLAAGAMFGLGWGLLLVSFASSLGALLAFLADCNDFPLATAGAIGYVAIFPSLLSFFFWKRAGEQAANRAGAVVHQTILVDVTVARRSEIRAAHDGKQRPVGGAGVKRHAHAIAGALAGENRNAATVHRGHVGQPVNAKPMRVTLGDHRHVNAFSAHQHAAGDIDIVRTHQTAHREIMADLAIKSEHGERAVMLLVRADDQ
jgi:hypothetical protein